MQTVPNQSVIIVRKEPKGKKYNTRNARVEELAAQVLNAGAFKLWCYFSANSNGYRFALSKKDVASRYGIKPDQYYKAIAELVEVGYLVPMREDSNVLVFRESLGGEANEK